MTLKSADQYPVQVTAPLMMKSMGCNVMKLGEDITIDAAAIARRARPQGGSVIVVDGSRNAAGLFTAGALFGKGADVEPLVAEECRLVVVETDVEYAIGSMIDPGQGQAAVPAVTQASTALVNSQRVDKIVGQANPELAAKIKTDTVVEGVRLTTSDVVVGGVKIAPAGIQEVVDLAKAQNEALKAVLESGNASMVTVKVEVSVLPVKYEAPADAPKTISFALTPKAVVTVVGDATAPSETVKVTNEMIDQTVGIAATIVTGFRPKSIVHRNDNGDVIDTFTDDQIAYDETTGKATVIIYHFSTLEATDKDCVALVNGVPATSLDDAFAAVGDTPATIRLMKDVALSAAITLAEGKTALFDLNGKALTWAGAAAASGLIANSGTLTVSNGTINAGAGNVFVTSPAGTVTLLGGTYTGAFPGVTDVNATHSSPVQAAGGSFYVAGPIAPAYWAPGYEANYATEAPFGVKDANVYIRNIEAAQRYPWNGYVDITLDVCWSEREKARLFVIAYDGDNKRMDMTEASVIDGGVTTDVECDRGFEITAPTKKTIHLMWNSTEAVSEGQVREGVHFKFLAK